MFNILKIFNKKETKPSKLLGILNNLDDCVYTMTIENDELVIRIRRKEEEQA